MEPIIKKYLEGNATDEEQIRLLEWLRKKENCFVFNSYSLSWRESLDLNQLSGESLKSWNQIQTVILEKSFRQWQRTRKIQSFFRYAAIFFFILAIGSLSWYYITSKPEPQLYTSVVAENGQISKVELPDGSLVWLNSGSKITYNNLFAKGNRNIQLTGEAYFNVSHNEHLPLVVSCGELKVKVLGTKFNVNAYNNHEHINIVLEKGSIELSDCNIESFNFRLHPGERAKFDKELRKISVSNVNTLKFTSWKDGIINIYDQSLEQVVKRLEMRYNQKFKVDEEVKGLRYTFTIKNESLGEIVKLMEKITPVKAFQKDDLIVFEMDKDKMRKSMNKL